MRIRKLHFSGSLGDTLAAQLDLPNDGQARACALFAHCFTCGKDLKAAHHISQTLTQRGLAVLRFDFTGIGQSQGDFAATSFTSNVADLVAASEFLAKTAGPTQLLIGHSLGGAAAIQAAARISSVKAVVTIGAPAEPVHVKKLLVGAEQEIETKGFAEVEIEERRFRIGRTFLEDLRASNMQQVITKLKKALLIMHAPMDQIVGVNNAATIFTAAKHPKSFCSLDSADHLLSNPKDAQYAAEVIAAWAMRYLELKEPEQNMPEAPEGQVVVRTGQDGFTTTVQAGKHGMIADEPTSVGGANLGPSPYGYLLAALGACTSMTLRMYADHKKWPLHAAQVTLEHSKIHAKDCLDCETTQGKVDHIVRKIAVEGPLSSEQQKRLLEIADRCPVHRSLHSEIHVTTTAEESNDEAPGV